MRYYIHDNSNPGFFFSYCSERMERMQQEGCDPEIVTEKKAQSIWQQLGYTGTFEVHR